MCGSTHSRRLFLAQGRLLGREMSVIAGERNKASVHDWKANHTEDEYIRYMGSFYADQD